MSPFRQITTNRAVFSAAPLYAWRLPANLLPALRLKSSARKHSPRHSRTVARVLTMFSTRTSLIHTQGDVGTSLDKRAVSVLPHHLFRNVDAIGMAKRKERS
jgi:hypothetical protein